jgi:hypothetical protein
MEACPEDLSREETEAVLDPSDPASAFLLDCYHAYRYNYARPGETIEPDRPLSLCDVFAFCSLVHPGLYDLQSLCLVVEEDGGLRRDDAGSPVTYALSSNWPALKPSIVALLGGKSMSRSGCSGV